VVNNAGMALVPSPEMRPSAGEPLGRRRVAVTASPEKLCERGVGGRRFWAARFRGTTTAGGSIKRHGRELVVFARPMPGQSRRMACRLGPTSLLSRSRGPSMPCQTNMMVGKLQTSEVPSDAAPVLVANPQANGNLREEVGRRPVAQTLTSTWRGVMLSPRRTVDVTHASASTPHAPHREWYMQV
jgi:hypothetical protein